MAIFQRKYNSATVAATHIRIPIVKRGVVDFAVSADWTPATGDVKVSKDGGAAANITTLPTAITMGNTAYWEFPLSASEVSCKQLVVTVADSATKAVEDQAFVVETFGNASAMYPSDPTADTVDAENRFLTAVKTNILGTVGTGSTTTSIVTSSLDPSASATDQFKGRIVLFTRDTTSANLRGQGTDITASTAGGVLTVSALSHAPVSGDTFVIV
jgi:hypothetical protein